METVPTSEIRSRTEIGKTTFVKVKDLLIARRIPLVMTDEEEEIGRMSSLE